MADPKPLPVFTGEPVASIAVALGAVVNACIIALPVFNVPVTWEQQFAIATIFTSLLTLATVYQRSRVTPVEKAENAIDAAYQAQPGQEPKPTL